MLPLGDTKLVKILDTALADTARRSGDWLVCKPGCTQCCVGVFAIHQLDAARLEQGLQELSASDPERARSVRERARRSVARLKEDFPGDPTTGLLYRMPLLAAVNEHFHVRRSAKRLAVFLGCKRSLMAHSAISRRLEWT